MLLVPMLLCAGAQAQSVIEAFPGTPDLDGVVASGEWDLAPTIGIGTAPGDTCRVAVMTDANGAYFAFMGHLESSNALFPEVLLDTQHDRTAAWNTDDHWFHVSATDCHDQGAYGVYSNCLLVQPDWTGVPNLTPGAPITDTVEIGIPWTKLALAPVEGDSIGLCLLVTNTASTWRLWPDGASRLAPVTWGHLVVPFWNGMAEPCRGTALDVWPNPVADAVNLAMPGTSGPVNVRIIDVNGCEVLARRVAMPTRIAIAELPAGTYLCSVVTSDGERIVRRLAVVR
ncbi:MAG: T9SS type A sorting domain-containing protein [Flavobacteriales bacterium]|nr:T9SS type A sorting domain-containing protein [Flavobacteriales bacterium]